jgi:Cu/Ag efflux protein CusF
MKAVLESLVAVAMLTALALAPVATAQTGTAKMIEGKVMTVDPTGKSVTLDDGTKLMIPASVQFSKADLKPGAAVRASYEEKDGQKILTNLQVSK